MQERLESALIGWLEYAGRVEACAQFMDAEVSTWSLEDAGVTAGDPGMLAQRIANTEVFYRVIYSSVASVWKDFKAFHTFFLNSAF